MKIIYPGSFDPFTNGHLDILLRGVKIFGSLVIGIVKNIHKSSLLSLEIRKLLIEEIIKQNHLEDQIKVITFEGLFVDFLKKNNIQVVLRGVRLLSDFESEMQLALNNKQLYDDMETILLFTNPIYGHISSQSVREIYTLNGDLKEQVPPNVLKYLESLGK